MTISIVVPSYNQSQYLPEAIESALAQTIPCQIIIVDDGSTDDSLKIAKSYEPRVRVISQVNKGLSAARNAGIMWAHGDYILPLDADDILLENCVEKLIEKIEETNADIVSPSFRSFGLHEGITTLMPSPKLEDFKVGNRIGYCSAIKLKLLLEVGGYSPRMTFGYEDLHLTINLLSRGANIETISEVLWLYRTKEKSMIHEAQSHHEELMNQIYKDFPHFNA